MLSVTSPFSSRTIINKERRLGWALVVVKHAGSGESMNEVQRETRDERMDCRTQNIEATYKESLGFLKYFYRFQVLPSQKTNYVEIRRNAAKFWCINCSNVGEIQQAGNKLQRLIFRGMRLNFDAKFVSSKRNFGLFVRTFFRSKWKPALRNLTKK